ncbi:MAG: tRNA pseudouridine(38-40) synthase TruA [Thermoguttaceae bacterium]
MRNIKLTIAYEGTDYAGWQLQAGRRSVQEALESAIQKVTGAPSRVLASGRTDAGVHALGQVAAFRTQSRLAPEVLRRALNAHLPQDIAVLEAVEADQDFHPIRDAARKRYRYVICDGPVRDVFRRRTAWHCPAELDAEAMNQAAQALRGTHDFRSFETQGSKRRTSVRTVYEIQVRRLAPPDRHVITIDIEADGFLYNMVRCIVGTLVQVGRGNRPVAWVGQVLAARDRRAAGPTAPARGLFLVRVVHGEASCGRPGEVPGSP